MSERLRKLDRLSELAIGIYMDEPLYSRRGELALIVAIKLAEAMYPHNWDEERGRSQ